MAANINSNFPSINLIPSSIQGAAKQQQIQVLTNQVKGNEGKIAKIEKEIIAREKIIEATEKEIIAREKIIVLCEESKEAAKIMKVEALKMIDYGQKGIKACEESKEIINESKEIIKEMIGIYETLMARNNLQQANSLANENQSSTKTQIVFADIAYNPPKIDFSKFDTKPIEPQETKKSFNHITKDYKPRIHSSSIFNDLFNSLRSHSLRFFKWF
jgi:hypothetical protein